MTVRSLPLEMSAVLGSGNWVRKKTAMTNGIKKIAPTVAGIQNSGTPDCMTQAPMVLTELLATI